MTPGDRTATLDPTQPFTRAHARAAGLALSELLGPRYQKIFFDLYVSAATEVTPHVRAQAALLISHEGAFASHHTAARLWGACVPDDPNTHVSVPVGNRSERRGIKAHAALKGARTTSYRGVPVTTPVQTFLDLSSHLTLVELVVLGDSLVRLGRTTPGELLDASRSSRGRGARLARRAAGLARLGVDSPMESRLRMLIVLAGLPEPKVDLRIVDDDGNVVMRFDLSYPDLKLIIEYDGRQHAEDPAQWDHDVARREELDRLGWRLLVIRANDIYGRPDLALQRIRNTLRQRGATGLPGRFRSEWAQHFPVRAAR